MKILSYEYSEYPDSDRHWSVTGLELGPINLLVGRNASGKTRTLNTLNNLAALLRADRVAGDGRWEVRAEHAGQAVQVEIEIEGGRVLRERLLIDDEPMVERDASGAGTISYSEPEQRLAFEIAPHSVAMVAKRDKRQHPYLEILARWAEGERIYRFGEKMGRETLIVEVDGQSAQPSPYDTKDLPVLARVIFRSVHKADVISRVKEDMAAIGYAIEEIDWVAFQDYWGIMGDPRVLLVREQGVRCAIPHLYLSQGMFRALAIFMHLNYILLSGEPTCILIDDIGEGLDFARSTALIRRLIARVQEARGQDAQLVMTTNDQFVMNAVDLQYWSIILREGSHCRILNERNSKKLFDDFRFIGLNNFDFLELEFWNRESDVTPA